MPRDLPVGNGRLLVNFDGAYQLRDLYFPHVGKENHTAGRPCRFGVWAEGALRWTDHGAWQRTLLLNPDTGATDVELFHPELQLRLRCMDVVDYQETLYLRRIVVCNERDQARQVKLFFHHDFRISESEVGDTAYYEPARRALIHYKGARWFMANAGLAPDDDTPPPAEAIGFDAWATGTKEVGGAEGTWRDAEDGELGRNAIAQGAVDSTGSVHLWLPPASHKVCYYWIAAGTDFDAVASLNRAVREHGPTHFIGRTASYWRLWVNVHTDLQTGGGGGSELEALPAPLLRLYKASLQILRTQVDSQGGILAANDWDITQYNRDTYSYVWPRDGALVAHALDVAGYSGPSRRFFEFCARARTKEGYFLHKYNPDGSLGSSWQPWMGEGHKQLPIQEDETALVLWSLWHHFTRFRDVEFAASLYETLVVPAARFLISYRHTNDGLPIPSYDLWEERRGVMAFTVGAVYGGLWAAAQFASVLGDHHLEHEARRAMEDLRTGTDSVLWRPEANRFVRMVQPKDDGSMDVDWTVDASVYGLWAFGMYEADDPRIVATMQQLREALWVRTPVGGLARYQDDYYQQVTKDTAQVPGNPWFICTIWLAQWYVATARRPEDLQPALDLLHWAANRALPSGVLAEQVHPYTGEPLSVSPLTWSHATYVTAVVEFLRRNTELRAALSFDAGADLPLRLGAVPANGAAGANGANGANGAAGPAEVDAAGIPLNGTPLPAARYTVVSGGGVPSPVA